MAMKNLCKRIIAAALCLALTAAIVPTAVLAAASDGVAEQSGVKDGRFFPGRVIIGLNEPYFGDVAELFPELDIVKAVDQ